AIGGASWLGIAGAVICNSVADRFRDQPDLLLPVAFFLVAHRYGKSVTDDLPLCPTCNTSWDAGLWLQKKAILGMSSSAALVLFISSAGEPSRGRSLSGAGRPAGKERPPRARGSARRAHRQNLFELRGVKKSS